jgi:hypothetical protein
MRIPVGADGGVTVVGPWVTKIFQPATAMIPERDEVAVFGANVGRSVPLPLPAPAVPNVIQGTFAVAVQAHPVGAVIVMSREPVVRLKLVGETM